MDAAIEAPSPWVKKWDDQLYEVVYHHPERNETIATVEAAKRNDVGCALTRRLRRDCFFDSIELCASTRHLRCVYNISPPSQALAVAQAPPTSWIKHWDHDASKVVYVNIERNVTVLTVGEAVASDHAAVSCCCCCFFCVLKVTTIVDATGVCFLCSCLPSVLLSVSSHFSLDFRFLHPYFPQSLV